MNLLWIVPIPKSLASPNVSHQSPALVVLMWESAWRSTVVSITLTTRLITLKWLYEWFFWTSQSLIWMWWTCYRLEIVRPVSWPRLPTIWTWKWRWWWTSVVIPRAIRTRECPRSVEDWCPCGSHGRSWRWSFCFFIQVYLEGDWLGVCDGSLANGDVICRQLGFSIAVRYPELM